MTRSETRRDQAGFSLIELMIAMVATMIIAGAVFELVNAGNSAFRREPGLADRQQQIRMAMSIISEDILRAGRAMPQFQQTFENGLNGVGPLGSGGENTDEIQMITAADCAPLSVCDSPGTNIVTRDPLSACYTLPNIVILVDLDSEPQRTGVFWAQKPGAGSNASCGGTGGNNGHVNLPAAYVLNPPGGPGFDPEFMMVGAMARYRINADADGIPNLERSPAGGQQDTSNDDTWQIIARGIEDLQVEYLNGSGAWADEPGNVGCGASCTSPTAADYDTIVRKVRVRLSARALVNNIQGQTTSAVGDAARGEMVTEVAPTAALVAVGIGDGER